MLKRRIMCVLLAGVLMVSGCSTADIGDAGSGSETTAETTVPETSETTAEITETTKAPEPLEFNPHVHTDLLSEYVTEDMWTSLYNCIDAVRAGEDTFDCSDEDAFKWCTDDTILGSFLPPACTLVGGDGYEDGTGRLKYKMDKDKYLEREKVFEDEVVRMLNEAVRSDYSDFEKLMGIYAYVCRNFQYDYSSIDGNTVDEFSTYACLMTKQGICCEIAGALSYLLLQCGVEATEFGGEGSAGYHDWTYVVIGGEGYHVDATWAVYGGDPYGVLNLKYFMQTEAERVSDGFEEKLEVDHVWPWKRDYDLGRFKATDEKFKPLHDWVTFQGMDTERNVIFCTDTDGNHFEFSYGDI